MPVTASPAQRKRSVCSASVPPVTRKAEKIPESATASGSLDVVWRFEHANRSRYLRNKRKAVWLAKSSNWMRTPGKASHAALMNSSIQFVIHGHEHGVFEVMTFNPRFTQGIPSYWAPQNWQPFGTVLFRRAEYLRKEHR